MIDSIAKKIAKAPQTPVVIAVASDGEENSSQKYKLAQVVDVVTHRRFTCGWQFLFLSCNESASQYALNLGIPVLLNACARILRRRLHAAARRVRRP